MRNAELRLFLLSIFIILISGCVTRKIIQPEQLVRDSTMDVLITTNSGKLIRIYSDNYRITQIDTTKYVVGKGTILKENNQNISRPHHDIRIPFYEIMQVETTEQNLFYYLGFYVFAGAAACIIIALVLLNGRGLGG